VPAPVSTTGESAWSRSSRSNASCRSAKKARFCALTRLVVIVTTATRPRHWIVQLMLIPPFGPIRLSTITRCRLLKFSSIAASTPALCLPIVRAALTNGFSRDREAHASHASRRSLAWGLGTL
jgi:hypothetical protein